MSVLLLAENRPAQLASYNVPPFLSQPVADQLLVMLVPWAVPSSSASRIIGGHVAAT